MDFVHSKLCDLLKIFIEKMKHTDIQWFIHSGSLLGAFREQKIINHDDDVDIHIFEKDVEQFYNLFNNCHNIEIIKWWYGFRISFTNGKVIVRTGSEPWSKNFKYPFLDIFTLYTTDGIHHILPDAHKYWMADVWSDEELYPLKTYYINDIPVYGPNVCIPYFIRSYGIEWKIPKDMGNLHNV